MSRGYEVQWKTARNTVRAGDEVEIEIDLLCVLDKSEMNAILRAELEKDGWVKNEDGSLSKKDGDVVSTLPQDSNKITVRIDRQKTVVVRGESEELAEAALKKAEEANEAAMKKKIIADLLRVEEEAKRSLDGAVQRTYVDALKKRAAKMGQITSVVENVGEGGQHEVVISVEVPS